MRASSGSARALQPIEQRHAEVADDPRLGKVHVRVDEARQQHAVGQIGYRLRAVPGAHLGERAAVGDLAVAGDEQPGVGLGAQRATVEWVLRRVEDLGTIDRHDRAPLPSDSSSTSGSVSRSGSASRSNVRSRSAATLTAIVAGSLPLMSGSPIGVLIRAIV